MTAGEYKGNPEFGLPNGGVRFVLDEKKRLERNLRPSLESRPGPWSGLQSVACSPQPVT